MTHIKMITQQPLAVAQSDITVAKILDTVSFVLDFITTASAALFGMFGGLVDAAVALIDAKAGTTT